MTQENILDDFKKNRRYTSKLLANQWWFLIWEFTLLIVTLTHLSLNKYWPTSRPYLANFGEILGFFILFYIAAIPFFNKFIESVRLRITIGLWLLINYGLVCLALSRVLLKTFDYFLLVGIALSYIAYAIKAPSFEAQEKGIARKRALTLFYLGSWGTFISALSCIYKKPVITFYYLTIVVLLLAFIGLIYLIYKNRDDFELLLYLPRLLLAFIMSSFVIYWSI